MSHWHPKGKAMRWAAGILLLSALAAWAGYSHTTRAAASADTRASAATAPSTMVTTVGQTLYSNSSLSVTLTTMSVTGDEVTANVSYQDVGSSEVALSCSGLSVPAIDTLTSANGAAIPASRTYCSDNPTIAIGLLPGGTLDSYAVFDGVQASSGPFTLTWQETTPSGTVSGITL